jgi:plastocyanin
VSITGGSTSGGGTFGNNPGGPPVCGVAALGQSPCTFAGGNDIEIAGPNPGFDAHGNPAAADWLIKINAPPGKYNFFCAIHPSMQGTLLVANSNQPASTQAQIDAASQSQFVADRAEGLAAERKANVVRYTGGKPGTRTYEVHVGVATPDDRVAINEMLPTAPLNLIPGDSVRYVWTDGHNIHSVALPAGSPSLPPPFGFDCGHNAFSATLCNDPIERAPETIGDPGNAPSGSILTSVTAMIDAGVRVGTQYGVSPSSQSWEARVTSISAPGAYNYQCTIHDWMHGTINVSAGR